MTSTNQEAMEAAARELRGRISISEQYALILSRAVITAYLDALAKDTPESLLSRLSKICASMWDDGNSVTASLHAIASFARE